MRWTLISLCCLGLAGQPRLGLRLDEKWPQMPAGWNFGETAGVAVDRDDNVWVFHRGKHPVIQFSREGRFLRAWEEVPVQSAHGIEVDPDGNVWTVDVAGHTVLKFNPAGRILQAMGGVGFRAGTNESKDMYNRPTAVAFLPDGSYYVSDGYENSRVVKYSRDGLYQFHWGRKGKGEGEFDLVHDVTLDRAGRVYIADRSNSRIQVFDGAGKFLAQWASPGQPWGLHYHAKEDVLYMVDGLNERISKVDLNGRVLGVFGEYGKTPGKLNWGHHLAVDSSGAVYVAEIKNWRVQKFAPAR